MLQSREVEEAMHEAIEEFIEYTESTFSTPQEQIIQYQKLLRDVFSGSWHFSPEFNRWREQRST